MYALTLTNSRNGTEKVVSMACTLYLHWEAIGLEKPEYQANLADVLQNSFISECPLYLDVVASNLLRFEQIIIDQAPEFHFNKSTWMFIL